MLLSVEHLTKHFGGVTAVNRVGFQVEEGEILAIIGPNGAGKTTLFNLITGITGPDEGSVIFKGKDITGKPPDEIAASGITRTFQNLQLFHNMSVVENVMVGAHRHGKISLVQAGIRWPGTAAEEADISNRALKLLDLVGLTAKKDLPAETLPYGEQRLLEIARAMAVEPDLILLDEPAAGLNQSETEQLAGFISELPSMGMTVLLVEHNMEMVMTVANRIVVLDYGAKIAQGPPETIQRDTRVINAYLGEEMA